MAEILFEQIQQGEREPTTMRGVLTRGVAVDEKSGIRMVLPTEYGLEQLMGEKRIRLYLGIDPTSPELHIGHTVPLRKLRQFQDLGHEVILLFGTFTGKIGDPSDKGAARVRLTDEQIAFNLKKYEEQAGKILDLSKEAKNPINIKFNHEWLAPLNFEQLIDLSANFTVQQMLARSGFRKRMDEGKPVSLHEFLYPLMQGYDSVALDVDLEVGGKDQVPNMMDGRTLINVLKNHEKWVMGTRLIEDPSGKKMGKTEGNIVNISDLPEVKYEGIMTWPDSAIQMGFELITSVPMEMVYQVGEKLQAGELSPVAAKEALAYRVVAELDGPEEASYAREEFTRVKREGKLPRRMPNVSVAKDTRISEILASSGLAKNAEEAALRISQKSIFINGKPIEKDGVWPSSGEVISVGRKTIKNIRSVKTI